MTAASRAYDHVKQRLLSGDYADGELLSEGAIADELGVSRTPVREALLQLQAEHLLTLYPKRGALVTPMSPRAVADLFEVRELVERHTLRLAEPEVAVPQLEAVLTRQRELLAADDRAGFVAADRDFHRAWVAAAGNAILLDLYDGLRDRQHRLVAGTVAADATRASAIVGEHLRIVIALRAGDHSAAERALLDHLDVARAASGAPPRRDAR
ncbi:GntR family transcriptional regulator [Conexibacter sp. JD483]|uniref:GntR family transcriptional regulator n=1 Tax=unclassified Conexibacter TaxID=2627773 RepID=UPI00271BDD6B|nr:MULTISPECIES: GntR family transcriptional regulator [unclassified Conexibacter]MDO8185104.1 GntR family transcriptional regulator [Conexibacter sp. CPCC 205706]MDO8196814.1 GntR family transcriptional regulator [Conexibacter sp. CPCC 205762]MDR9368062.1 GntR family transcriptional regulator [Conexibacter sp. JD483]